MLEVKDLSLSWGARSLLHGGSFTIYPGDKVGLVGVNGAGKTTLLRAVADEVVPDRGRIRRPRRWAYLSQQRVSDAGLGMTPGADWTARQALWTGTELGDLDAELQRLAEQVAQANGDLSRQMARYSQVEERFRVRGGYDAEHRLRRILAGLDLGDLEWERPLGALSGGQKTRLGLARALFAEPDLLLLDEPTNHLDGPAARWLMDFLSRFRGALLIVSHDLGLLDKAITRVLHLDEQTQTLIGYRGTYSAYQKQRAADLARLEREAARGQAEIQRLRESADRFRGKTEKVARRAQTLDTRRERLAATLPKAPATNTRTIKVTFPPRQPSGRIVLTCQALSKLYGRNVVLANLDLQIERGERLLVMGLNGAGKTTLLRCLAGVTEPSAGLVELGVNVDLGYYAQEHEGLDPDTTVLDSVKGLGVDQETRLRTVLGMFLFSGGKVFQKVGTLSGGEKTRLALARLMLAGHNALLLDEPTNNLDPTAREAVTHALATYSGTLIVVSHDVEFVRALRPERTLLLPDGLMEPYTDEALVLVEMA